MKKKEKKPVIDGRFKKAFKYKYRPQMPEMTLFERAVYALLPYDFVRNMADTAERVSNGAPPYWGGGVADPEEEV
jgi:hypothetical protein